MDSVCFSYYFYFIFIFIIIIIIILFLLFVIIILLFVFFVGGEGVDFRSYADWLVRCQYVINVFWPRVSEVCFASLGSMDCS